MFDWVIQMLGAQNTDAMTFGGQVLKIIWINILLSGDNAVVIALACRKLPPKQRMTGIVLGAAVAVAMRVVFTVGVTSLMSTPWLKVIGALLLLWIAVKLLTDHADETNVAESSSISGAVKTIAIADLVMSLDNVLAIAAAAKGNWSLIVLGLVISVPLIVFGATLVMLLLNKYPFLVWAGAALLGFIAGEMLIEDAALAPYVNPLAKALGWSIDTLGFVDGLLGAVFVLAVASAIRAYGHQEPEKAK